MSTDYKFDCACGNGCKNYLKIEYFGSNGKPLENLTFKIRGGKTENTSDIECSKIPQLIENLQTIYKKYEQVIKKQGKLELLSEQNNKPNLSEQEGAIIEKPLPKDPIKNFELPSNGGYEGFLIEKPLPKDPIKNFELPSNKEL